MFRAIQKQLRHEQLRRQGFEDAMTGRRLGYVRPGYDAEEREAYAHGRDVGEAAVKHIREGKR